MGYRLSFDRPKPIDAEVIQNVKHELCWAPSGGPRAGFAFTIARGKIVGIEMVADPERLGGLDVTIFKD
jgi:hypothetical protein